MSNTPEQVPPVAASNCARVLLGDRPQRDGQLWATCVQHGPFSYATADGPVCPGFTGFRCVR